MSLGGLSGISGIDTESLINKLMMLERRPLNKLEVRQQQVQQRSDVLKDVNTRLVNLIGKLEALADTSLFGARKATSSNEDVVTATADSGAIETTYEINVTQLAQAHRIASDGQGAGWTWTGVDGAQFQIGLTSGSQQTITVNTGDTLDKIAEKINEAEAGVTASVVNDTLVLESSKTGAANTLDWTDTDGVLTDLGVVVDDGTGTGTLVAKNPLQDAKDAEFEVNGISATRASNTVSDVVDGVTFTLKAITTDGPVDVTIAENHEAVLGKIEEFVAQYNSIHSFIQSKTGEGAEYQGYSTLVSLENRLWSAISDKVVNPSGGSTYSYLAEVGISVDRHGALQFDEEKFKEALETDPEAVKNLFTATEADEGFDGMVARATAFVESYTSSGDGIISQQQQIIKQQIESIEDHIVEWENRLALRRQTLEQQFLAMEMSIVQMRNQGAWLSAQVGQLGSFSGGIF